MQPYTGRNSRFECPGCGAVHQFSRYVDTETGEIIADNVGRCNRIDKCGYHYTPKQYFTDNGQKIKPYEPKSKPKPKPISFIDYEIYNYSLKGYENNNLIKYLKTLFDDDTVNLLIYLYKIGTSTRYGGGTTVFWQKDSNDNIRAGKLIKYDNTGHRMHGKNNWVHSILNIDNFNLKQCFFGEHILKHAPDATVCIVESEKTAIIAAAFMPDIVWLATGGAENLNKEKAKVLQGRSVILFPDASKDSRIYNKWLQKANEFGFDCSDYLEQYATDEQKVKGVDIADYLINQDWQLFRKRNIQKQSPHPEPENVTKVTPKTNILFSHGAKKGEWLDEHYTHGGDKSNAEPSELAIMPVTKDESANTRLISHEPPEKWSNDIAVLENYFKSIKLPTQPIKLNEWTTITDCSLFIDSHFATVKANNGKRTFLPYLNRLKEIKQILTIK